VRVPPFAWEDRCSPPRPRANSLRFETSPHDDVSSGSMVAPQIGNTLLCHPLTRIVVFRAFARHLILISYFIVCRVNFREVRPLRYEIAWQRSGSRLSIRGEGFFSLNKWAPWMPSELCRRKSSRLLCIVYFVVVAARYNTFTTVKCII
jgi:hypothetical protein